MTAVVRRPRCAVQPHKVKYLTEHGARTSRQARTWPHLNPYECPSCGYWHLTSKQREKEDQ